MRWISLLSLALLFACAAPGADLAKLHKQLAEKKSELAPADVEGRLKLAKWCHQKKLRQSELRLYREVIQLDPDNEDAREALGHVSDGETWYENDDAMQVARGRTRRLTTWVDGPVPDCTQLHEHWLTADELAKLEDGDVLHAHSGKDWHEVLTREFRIRSHLKDESKTLELARVLEQAVRIWREDAGLEYERDKARTLHCRILKDHGDFRDMMEDDIESFGPEMAKTQGYFDGRRCWLSYFHDWYRTRRVLLHEARHQFDMLVAGKLGVMPAWYREGIAEYWSMHKWDGEKLKLGELVPEQNYSLHFCKKLLRKRDILGAEDTLNQDWWGVVDPVFYQNSWAFIYYLRNSDYAEGFGKFEAELLKGSLRDNKAVLTAFKNLVTEDLDAFDDAYLEQLEKWADSSPDNMR